MIPFKQADGGRPDSEYSDCQDYWRVLKVEAA